MVRAKAKLSNLAPWPLAGLVTVALLLVALTSSASAGSGGNSKSGNRGKGTGVAAHGKCKKHSNKGAKSSSTKKSNGSKKSSKKKKCGKRKHGPGKPNHSAPPVVTPPATPPAAATLAINPASFDFGTVAHGGFGACQPDPDPDCPTHAFTVTNTGGSTSGVPTASIVETHNPEIGGPAAFAITANTCTTSLAPGASCSLTVKFAPNSNAGDEMFSSRLDVTASPGSTASSVLSGMAT